MCSWRRKINVQDTKDRPVDARSAFPQKGQALAG